MLDGIDTEAKVRRALDDGDRAAHGAGAHRAAERRRALERRDESDVMPAPDRPSPVAARVVAATRRALPRRLSAARRPV